MANKPATQKNLFLRFVSNLVRIGAAGIEEEEARNRTMMVNRICLAAGLCLTGLIPTLCYFLHWDPLILSTLLLEFILNASVLYWNHKKKYVTAACILYFLQIFAIPFYGVMLGRLLQLELTIVLLFAISFLVFKKHYLRTLAICGALLDLVCLEIYYFTHPEPKFELTFNQVYIIQLLVVLSITSITLLVSRPYVKSNDLRYELERANHFIKIFIAQITHEIRTPLNVIHQIAQLLKKEIKKDESLKSIDHYIDITLAETKSCKNIVNNVLNMSEIESGKLEKASKVTIAVKPFFEGIIEGKKIIAKVDSMQIKLLIEENMPAAIITDPYIVEQIVTNLLANAIKYGENKTTIDVQIGRSGEDEWSIKVINAGPGIPQDKVNSIFDLFYTVKTDHVEGTGLGLYIVKHKVDALNGRIEVESIPNYKTAFTVTLPLAIGKLSQIVQDISDLDPNIDLHGIHVLLAEDHKLAAMILFMHLDELGCKVTTVPNGLELIREAQRLHPDVIVMDYHMPLMDGPAAARHLKSDPTLKQIPIIVTTGDLYSDSIEKMLEAGADTYMEKPVDVRPLQEAISRQIAKKRKS